MSPRDWNCHRNGKENHPECVRNETLRDLLLHVHREQHVKYDKAPADRPDETGEHHHGRDEVVARLAVNPLDHGLHPIGTGSFSPVAEQFAFEQLIQSPDVCFDLDRLEIRSQCPHPGAVMFPLAQEVGLDAGLYDRRRQFLLIV